VNLQQIAERASAIATDLETLTALPEWTDEQRSQFDALNTELGGLETRKADIEARSAVLARAQSMTATGDAPARYSAPNITVKKDPFDLNELRYGAPVAELRGRAKAAVESVDYIDDSAKTEVFRKLEGGMADPRGVLPGLVLRTGSKDYTSAFHKYLAGQPDLLTNEERSAVQMVGEYRTAMGLTDANGGYAIPFTLDPSIILTNDGAINPVRRLARQVSITTDTWNGISSAGVTASFDAELAEVSDDSPTFAQPTITTRMGRAFVQASIEITQDFANLAGEITSAFADAKDRLESTVFWSGSSGSNQPIGIETALNGGSYEVAQSAGEAMTVADLYKTLAALPPRYRMGSRVAWTAELSTINFIRQFATANNYHAFLTDLTGDSPATLLGKPLYEWSSMDVYSTVPPMRSTTT
jgi:HK97 family phage major capsid protein